MKATLNVLVERGAVGAPDLELRELELHQWRSIVSKVTSPNLLF